MSENRSKRYLALNRYEVQAFVERNEVRDLLKLKYCELAEGDSSILLAIPTRRIDDFMRFANKYSLMVVVKQVSEKKKRYAKEIHQVIDDTIVVPENLLQSRVERF